ncbi:MAG: hypothetical protein ACR2RL_12195 [Gammaproteobacteria bacterium]
MKTGKRIRRLVVAVIASVVTAVIAPLALAQSEGLHSGRSSSAFLQIARAAMQGDELARVDFARVAVAEMAREHDETLSRVRSKGGRTRKDRSRHARWLANMWPFVDGLYALIDAIDFGAAVDVVVLAEGTVQIVVDDRNLIVSALDINQPEVLEARIVSEFCVLYYCEFSAYGLAQDLERVYDPVGSEGRWSFARGFASTFETHDGLRFMFTDVKNKPVKEQACLTVARELRMVAEQIGYATSSGYQVDWRYVHVRTDPATAEQHVVINKAGDFIPLDLPGLSVAQGALSSALPWIKSRLRGEEHTQSFPGADALLRRLL